MVLFATKYDINPDKVEAYNEWGKVAIPAILAAPGVVEFRGYRPVTGGSQVAVTIEFADLEAWAAWYADAGMQKIMQERYEFEINVIDELWGPSPIVPEPRSPGA